VVTPEAMTVLADYDWPGNIRELKNLVESMVVLATGRAVGVQDLPEPIRSRRREPPALPVHVPQPAPDAETSPALEFVFRMMLQLRLDVDDLRREFDSYRREHPDFPGPLSLPYPYPYLESGEMEGREVVRPVGAEAVPLDEEADEDEEDGVVVFRIGERTLYRKIKEYGIPL